MNGQQRAVLWIGLILIGLTIVRRWSEVRDVIFNGAGITAGIPGMPGSSNDGGGLGGIIGRAGKKALGGIMPGGGIPFLGDRPPQKTKDVMV